MKYILPAACILFLVPMFASAHHLAENALQVTQTNLAGEKISSFNIFDDTFRGDASIVVKDLSQDNIEEVIIGSGHGAKPLVKIFTQSGELINEFLAYDEGVDTGVNIAVCDIANDGDMDIVVGSMYGGGPHVRIFNADGTLENTGFFPYPQDFRGGVSVACGDVDGDGTAEIITGAGNTGGPHVIVFDGAGNFKYEIFAGSASETTGVNVATADVNGDGDMEIITARSGIGDSTIMLFDVKENKLMYVLGFNTLEDYRGGINIFGGDIDSDGMDEMGVSPKSNNGGMIRFYEMTGIIKFEMQPYGENYTEAITTSMINTKNGPQIFSIATAPQTSEKTGKYIKVDDATQTMYVYENGSLVRSYLVSTGIRAFPSPRGETQVTDKLLWHDYVWNYGEGSPYNYNLPNVKNNLRFRPHYYIHSAYWHNNFGHRMSHGCINAPALEAEWTYNWADVGTKVEIVN